MKASVSSDRRSRIIIAALVITFALQSDLIAQSSAATRPQSFTTQEKQNTEFDAATIKPASIDPDGIRHVSMQIVPGGRILITNFSLRSLIFAAYNLDFQHVQKGPAWIDKDLFDVEAKPPQRGDNAALSYDLHHSNWSIDDPDLRTMLQELLKDRFQLKVHLETKTGPVYLLEKNGAALNIRPAKHPARDGGYGGVGIASAGVRVVNSSMAQLAMFLGSSVLHQPVIDETGLAGTYDYASNVSLSDEELRSFDPSLFLSALKDMGLKVTHSSGPVTTLFIDQAEHPSPN